ncbi:MAG: MMPL family transporter [Chthoniobacteraceae bacterium]
MNLDRTVAHFVTHHRPGLGIAMVVLALLAGLVLAKRARFASDVLDLLPQHFDSVQVFKKFDREFSQARELTIAIVDDSGRCDLDAFAEHFADLLREESWVERVMDRSPLESPQGLADVPTLAVPLLLDLPPEKFQDALTALEPAAIAARLHRLRVGLESGSPKAQIDLDFDPLGLVAPAFTSLAQSFSIEQTRPLVSEDARLRVILALTKEKDLGAHACQRTMRNFNSLRDRAIASWDGAKPRVLVTGRTAYVAELSLKMRNDIVATLASSALLVAVVFWIGFRRIRPLLAILFTLLLCCLVAVALGAFVFHELNMITIGLCAILVGLGVDFGMMLFGIYQSELDEGHDHESAVASALRHHGSGIIFGAITTAAAFLCLLLSETTGFMQLGVLIAVGIICAGIFMMTVFFVLLGKKHRPEPHDALKNFTLHLLVRVYRNPRRFTIVGIITFAILAAIALGPVGKIVFEANPKTLEPRHSDAGDALRTIQARMPAVGEPILALVEAPNAEEFHERWDRLQSHWNQLIDEGKLRSANSPAAFALSPHRVEANAANLDSDLITKARAALVRAIANEGLNEDAFAGTLGLLDSLAAITSGDHAALAWQTTLRASSPWWFVIDRFVGRSPNLGVAYITPVEPLTNFETKEKLRIALDQPGIQVHYSGWAYTLADLVPWAKAKLTELSAVMVLFNVLLLAFLFRRLSSLAVLMGALGLAILALVAALEIFGIPLNLFNVLAFPLVLGIGVDYGIYVIIAMRAPDPRRELSAILKPVLLSALTTAAGFGSLATAENPALRSLGLICGLGVVCCAAATFLLILPICVWRAQR